MPEPISPDLAPYVRGSVLALREWKTYTLTIPAAEALLVGSRLQQCHPAPGFFELEFQNQLGPTLLTPIVNGLPQSSVQVEVVASKFGSVRASIGFMTSIVSQLSARVSTLPFVMRANTARQMERMHREPSRFFAFHYLRHQTESLVRALQVIAADPHRKLDAIVEDLRIRQARAIDAEALHSLLVGPRAGSPNRAPNATPLDRLQPLRIRQRRPEETCDTAENRFVVSVCKPNTRGRTKHAFSLKDVPPSTSFLARF